MGLIQTSPYGAPAYKLENVTTRNIEYQDVIYEFSLASGMQLVIAHFIPSASADLYQQLQSDLGAPSSLTAPPDRPDRGEASWHLPSGTRVMYSGPYYRMVLIGKDGGELEADVRLRDQYVPAVP